MTLEKYFKGFIWNLAYLSGILALLARSKTSPDQKGIIFYYHRVHPKPGWDPVGINLLPSLFQRQLALLGKKKTPLALSEYMERLGSSSPPVSSLSFVITFDDGYQDVWEYAWPILRDFRIVPTFFVCTDPLIRRKPLLWDVLARAVQREKRTNLSVKTIWPEKTSFSLRTKKEKKAFVQAMNQYLLAKSGPEQNKAFETLFPEEAGKIRQQTADLYLDPTQLRECLKAGIEIGAHTASHPYLPLISLEERDWEIKESKIELESLIGKETPFFSYPAGKWDKEVREQVIRSGYRGALATGKRAVSLRDQDLFTVPRISPEGVMTMGKFYALLWGIKREWFE